MSNKRVNSSPNQVQKPKQPKISQVFQKSVNKTDTVENRSEDVADTASSSSSSTTVESNANPRSASK